MSDVIPRPPPVPPPTKSVVLRPSFLRACLGIWLFTWRSQLTWRRAPLLLVTLSIIPLLTFFTIEPLAHLTARYDWREQPHRQVSEFKAKAASEGAALRQGLGTRLTQILSEEQGRVEPLAPEPSPDKTKRFTESALNQQIEEARACQERVRPRVRLLLNDRQFALFEQWQQEKLGEAVETIQKFNLQNVRPFYRWLVDFYFLLVLPLYALSVCGAMIRDELQADTLGFLTTRPVGRARLFLIKYLCQMTWLQALAAVHGVLLCGAGFARDVPGVASMLGLFFGAQALAVLAWGALSALLGVITRRYMVMGIVYGFVVEMGIGRIPTNINTLSLTRHLEALLGHNTLLNQLYDWAPQSAWVSVGMVLLAAVIFLGVGAALFTFREYHHATEMQK